MGQPWAPSERFLRAQMSEECAPYSQDTGFGSSIKNSTYCHNQAMVHVSHCMVVHYRDTAHSCTTILRDKNVSP